MKSSFLVNWIKKNILIGSLRGTARRIKFSLRQWIFTTIIRDRRFNLVKREELFKNFQNYRVFQFGSEESVVIGEPCQSSDKLPQLVARGSGLKTWKKPFVVEVANAELVGPSSVGFDEKGRLIAETIPTSNLASLKSYLPVRTFILKDLPKWRLIQLDIVCPLITWWSSNYFHWLVECLTRIEGLEYYQEITGNQPLLIIDTNPSSWQIESLRILGYEPENCIRWNYSRIKVKRLVVPSLRREQRLTSPAACHWLRQRVLSNLPAVENNQLSFSPRIYISRPKTAGRYLINEDEVLEALSPLGFMAYTLENLSFADQVRLFSQAEMVVAPHGAGLANIIFAHHLNVIEIFGSYNNNPDMYMLAKALGFQYGYLTSIMKPDNHYSGITVDVAKLQSLVVEMLSINSDRQPASTTY